MLVVYTGGDVDFEDVLVVYTGGDVCFDVVVVVVDLQLEVVEQLDETERVLVW